MTVGHHVTTTPINILSLLLSYIFRSSGDGVFLHTRSDGKLFNLSRLRAKTKIRKLLLCERLFVDDAALASHSQEGPQRLISCLAHVCQEFGLTISLKKTNIMGQDVSEVVEWITDAFPRNSSTVNLQQAPYQLAAHCCVSGTCAKGT